MKFRCFFSLVVLLSSGMINSILAQSKANSLQLPSKENLWIFVLAGQSNMSGRGAIEAQDTIPNNRILTINSKNEIRLAKAPLHHIYEPQNPGYGLGCGMSFGSEMLKHVPDDVSILIIPTAVGGSAIAHWIDDETWRGVALSSNFKERVQAAQKHGTVKGILWHQGESDANAEKTSRYQERLNILFKRFRKVVGNEELPIVLGKLGSFFFKSENWENVNKKMEAYVASDKFSGIIETADLDHRGDRIHFNSAAQREMGKRFANAMLKLIETKKKSEALDVYMLMGQSNMAGRGLIDSIANSYLSDNVLMLKKDLKTTKAVHPVHFDKPDIAQVGPGLKFGYEMSLKTDNKILIVPCAVGGTAIDLWEPGKFDDITKTHPYDDAIARLRRAKQLGEIKGIIWHQGEGNKTDTLYWKKLETLIGRFREEAGKPELPFIAGELGYFLGGQEMFNTNLQELPNLISNTGVVSAEGLTHIGDDVHFDARSAELLGERYAEVMLKLIE